MKRLNAILVLLTTVVFAGMFPYDACAAGREVLDGSFAKSGDYEWVGKDETINGGVFDVASTANGTFTNSRFYENHANYGGAIWIRGGVVRSINTVDFINNSAKSNGGAIYSNGGTITQVINSSFVHNSASGDSSKGAGYGGAIYANKAMTIINILV